MSIARPRPRLSSSAVVTAVKNRALETESQKSLLVSWVDVVPQADERLDARARELDVEEAHPRGADERDDDDEQDDQGGGGHEGRRHPCLGPRLRPPLAWAAERARGHRRIVRRVPEWRAGYCWKDGSWAATSFSACSGVFLPSSASWMAACRAFESLV